MIRQQIKDVYFGLNRWLVIPNTWRSRLRFRTPRDAEGHYLHLGCGTRYIEGMINIDGYLARRADAWLDLRNRLPFTDSSAAFVYCSHTLEHLFVDEAIALLREVRRILRPDGVARFATPSLERALDIASGAAPWDFPKRTFPDPMGMAVDYLFCDGQHKYAYSFSVFEKFAREAGFSRIGHYSASRHTERNRYGKVEVGDELPGSLVVELRP